METRKNGKMILESPTIPDRGVVFLYASWSESEVFLKYLLALLEKYPQIDLYVYDVDKANAAVFLNAHKLKTHGKGETFWIHNGVIVSKILNYRIDGDNAKVYTSSLGES